MGEGWVPPHWGDGPDVLISVILSNYRLFSENISAIRLTCLFSVHHEDCQEFRKLSQALGNMFLMIVALLARGCVGDASDNLTNSGTPQSNNKNIALIQINSTDVIRGDPECHPHGFLQDDDKEDHLELCK